MKSTISSLGVTDKIFLFISNVRSNEKEKLHAVTCEMFTKTNVTKLQIISLVNFESYNNH